MRRDQIAEAGIRIIARRGVRALTHRAIDEERGLALGSTSYYARTRRALIDEIVRVLAERSIADLEEAARALVMPSGMSVPDARKELLDVLESAVTAFARRPDELKARYALLLELDEDEPARATLAEKSPVQQAVVQRLADALEVCDIEAPAHHAREVMTLCDALLMRSVIVGAPVEIVPTVSAYLRGLADTPRTGK
ncbi:TetR/AcrR family transcriptional regulator [Gordonia sp. (in: high G+C Gram-positive bacteria)]|uniref:TetR/AcrR family transcriptional regulator n=1 Tax=Gordonia sp. (in: high G+C Gram-positive bacteria) TaxID=84139 RepID=UPI003C795A93